MQHRVYSIKTIQAALGGHNWGQEVLILDLDMQNVAMEVIMCSQQHVWLHDIMMTQHWTGWFHNNTPSYMCSSLEYCKVGGAPSAAALVATSD